jgi:hypothetical protein
MARSATIGPFFLLAVFAALGGETPWGWRWERMLRRPASPEVALAILCDLPSTNYHADPGQQAHWRGHGRGCEVRCRSNSVLPASHVGLS